jgi:type III secretion protein N (ATPase)
VIPAPSSGFLVEPIAVAGERLRRSLRVSATRPVCGRIVEVKGPIARAAVSPVHIRELVSLRDARRGAIGLAEVIGFEGSHAVLAPFGAPQGLSMRTEVVPLGRMLDVEVSPRMAGGVFDGLGQLMGRSAPSSLPDMAARRRLVRTPAPSPLSRRPISEPFSTGIKAIDGLTTLGEGQRVAIIGSAGSGKSTLVTSLVRSAHADVVVMGLIGERGREVAETSARLAADKAMGRTIVIAATSDRPAVERMNAAFTATAVAEYFRDQGLKVLLVIDSVTRFARAAREVGLSRGEPPGRRAFPPSVFDELPRLFERAGAYANGSITAAYTVLAEGEVEFDPLAEEVKALVDGHIVLSPEMAAAGRFPAIDALASRSRVMDAVTDAEHRRCAHMLRDLMARHRDIELLLRVGEYKAGQDQATDRAVNAAGPIARFLAQDVSRPIDLSETVAEMQRIVR